MTTLLLVRHALADHVGRHLAGRSAGVRLNEAGRRQAAALAARLAVVALDAVVAGPLERAVQTAEPIAAGHGLPVGIDSDLTEIDYGDWTGRTLASLAAEPAWRWWNEHRGGTRVPGGETMAEAQGRMLRAMERLRDAWPDGVVAMIGHGDPIRAALAHCLGIPLDLALRLDVAPASVSVVRLAEWGPRVLRVNDTGELAME